MEEESIASKGKHARKGLHGLETPSKDFEHLPFHAFSWM
jgi:hypothetical protein